MSETKKVKVEFEIEDGQIVAPFGVDYPPVPPEQLHKGTFVTTILWEREPAALVQCCYYIWMGGKWVKVCQPC
jgi:hypothetical protein